MSRLTRRTVLAGTAAGLASAALPQGAFAQADEVESHGMSSFGDLALAAVFKHFGYVNPQAP